MHEFISPSGASPPHWSPDGKGLQYLLTRKSATNVWEQPLAGGEPRQVTDFTSGRIFRFRGRATARSLAGRKRKRHSRDVVLMSNFR